MPSGTVEKFSDRLGVFCVRINGDPEGRYAVFHLMAPIDPKVGDVVEWEGWEARNVVTNVSQQGAVMHVDRARYGVPKEAAMVMVQA